MGNGRETNSIDTIICVGRIGGHMKREFIR